MQDGKVKTSKRSHDRRRSEGARRESEYKLHQIIDTVPSFLWSADPTGEPTYINQRALDYSGMQLEDFMHGGWEAFIHPADFPETLTCHWHHARFDLESGCTFDLWADDVPIFPVELRNGEVWVRTTLGDADPAARWRRRLAD